MRTTRAMDVSTSAEAAAPRYSPQMRHGRWAQAQKQLFWGLCLAAIGMLSIPSRDEAGVPGFLLGLLALCIAALGALIWCIRVGHRWLGESQPNDVPGSPDR
jgi:hypothetical protein